MTKLHLRIQQLHSMRMLISYIFTLFFWVSSLPCLSEKVSYDHSIKYQDQKPLCHDVEGDFLSSKCDIESFSYPDHSLKFSSKSPGSFVALTYNIERGIEFATQVDFIREKIEPLPSIFLLSEVDRFCVRSGHLHIAYEYAQAFNLNFVYGVEEVQNLGDDRKCETGNAILSSFPIIESGIVDLEGTLDHKDMRFALWADVAWEDKVIRVYSTHLASKIQNGEIRKKQMNDIFLSAQGKSHVIVGGDFNTYAQNWLSWHIKADMISEAEICGYLDTHAGLGWLQRFTNISHGVPFVMDYLLVKGLNFKDPGKGSLLKDLDKSDHIPVWSVFHDENEEQ